MKSYEQELEVYLQSHFHPDVAPQVMREIKLGTVSIEGFLRLADIFHHNHEAIDADLENQEHDFHQVTL